MSFSIELIKSAGDADLLLQMAAHDKRNLLHNHETAVLRAENNADLAQTRAADLAAATADRDATVALLATLPEGKFKDDQETKKMALDLKIRRLSKTGSKVDPVSQLQTEYNADLQDRQIAGMDEFISAVTARKAAL